MQSSAQAAIRVEVSYKPLLVPAYFAQTSKIEMCVSVRVVQREAFLIRSGRGVIPFQLFKYNRAIEMKQCVIGEISQSFIEHEQRVLATSLGFA
jgi:hypothetical protein